MPDTKARAATIEIYEARSETTDSAGGSVVVPNKIVINGREILSPADHPVIVHEINAEGRDAVYVTVTMFARRVTIGAEDD